jgi:hypothetical protein
MNGMPSSHFAACSLKDCDVDCSGALFALLNFKGNSIAFSKRLEAGAVNSSVMDKHVCTVFSLNETVAFAFIKPLYDSIGHGDNLLPCKISCVPIFRLPLLTNGSHLQNETVSQTNASAHALFNNNPLSAKIKFFQHEPPASASCHGITGKEVCGPHKLGNPVFWNHRQMSTLCREALFGEGCRKTVRAYFTRFQGFLTIHFK